MRKINFLKLTAAALSLTFMMYFLIGAIKPDLAAAETQTDEIRATWVATVFGLDFPSGYSSDEAVLKEKIDDIMDDCMEAGLNTVFFQVRPASDAFYKSDIFPWSKYLTGTQGKAPKGGFDPLEYAISSAHKRNIFLHAWINPYRVTVSAGEEKDFSSDNPALLHKEYTVTHTDGKIYYNPGLPEVSDLIVSGAVEIAENYDVDGIHLDDYFYPGGDFADEEAFKKYGNGKSLDDWRRHNVTNLIRTLNEEIHKINPSLTFSVSPAGIWANKDNMECGSATAGAETYFDSYADTRLWIKENLIDMILPQIYWHRGFEIADFNILSSWWADTVEGTNVRLCPGIAAYRASDTTDSTSPWYGEKGIAEIAAQIDLSRLHKMSGYALYRYGSLASNKGLFEITQKMNKTDEPSDIFTDLNSFSWAKEAITSLYEKGIVKGYEDKSFGGGNTVTRADFTLMLIRATEKETEFTENFADVNEKDYFYKEIGMAKALNLISGLGENAFAPRNKISRQDMAVIAYRYLSSEGLIEKEDFNDDLFADGEEVKDYAREAVASLVDAGIINGYEDNTFRPNGNATRAETAVIIYRMTNLIK